MKKSIGLMVFAALAIATSSHAGAPTTLELTGTWEGKGSCAGLANGDKISAPTAMIVEISRFGDEFGAEFNFLATGGFPLGVTFGGCGFAVPETAKPDRGRAAIHGFDESAPFTIFGTADVSKVSVFPPDKKGRTGSMKGTVLVAVRDGADAILSCKFSAARTSEADPGIPFCVAPAIAVQ